MFCSECGTANDNTARFCEKCGAGQQVASGSAEVATMASPTMRRPTGGTLAVGKSPPVALGLAVCFNVIGQFYNGDIKKAIVMILAVMVLFIPTGGLVFLGVWLWCIVDAYQVANRRWTVW